MSIFIPLRLRISLFAHNEIINSSWQINMASHCLLYTVCNLSWMQATVPLHYCFVPKMFPLYCSLNAKSMLLKQHSFMKPRKLGIWNYFCSPTVSLVIFSPSHLKHNGNLLHLLCSFWKKKMKQPICTKHFEDQKYWRLSLLQQEYFVLVFFKFNHYLNSGCMRFTVRLV